MNLPEKPPARLQREVQHHIAQKDDVERLVEGQRLFAKVGSAKAAQAANFGSDSPLLATMDKEAHNIARGQAAIHLKSMVCPLQAASNRSAQNIRALDLHIPGSQLRKMLQQQHRSTVGLLAGRAGSAPDT